MRNPLTIILSVSIIIVSAGAALLYAQTQKLQSANSKLSAQLADANSQLDAANQEIAEMKPDVERARTLPLVIIRRPALTGSGYVYRFRNLLRKPLALHVILSNPAFAQPTEFHLVIDGGLFKEIGHVQGWSGAAGDTVKVECAGYDAVEKSYP